MRTPALVALFASIAAALQITAPALGEKWDLSGTNSVKWSSVATDPTEFSIVIIDQSASPPTQKVVAASVKTSEGKYDFTNFVSPPGARYQINLVGTGTSNSGILAQSQQFEVTKSGVAPTTTAAQSTTPPTGTSAPSGSTTPNAATSLRGAVAVMGGVAAMVYAAL